MKDPKSEKSRRSYDAEFKQKMIRMFVSGGSARELQYPKPGNEYLLQNSACKRRCSAVQSESSGRYFHRTALTSPVRAGPPAAMRVVKMFFRAGFPIASDPAGGHLCVAPVRFSSILITFLAGSIFPEKVSLKSFRFSSSDWV